MKTIPIEPTQLRGLFEVSPQDFQEKWQAFAKNPKAVIWHAADVTSNDEKGAVFLLGCTGLLWGWLVTEAGDTPSADLHAWMKDNLNAESSNLVDVFNHLGTGTGCDIRMMESPEADATLAAHVDLSILIAGVDPGKTMGGFKEDTENDRHIVAVALAPTERESADGRQNDVLVYAITGEFRLLRYHTAKWLLRNLKEITIEETTQT